MDNNNQYQQPAQPVQPVQPVQQVYQPAPVQQVYQTQQQPVDPNYAAVAKEFLTKAIVAAAICTLPIGSIIAINMASKNRKNILDYIGRGGLHTDRIKVSSAVSRAGKYGGIGFTIFWGFYLLYFAVVSITAIAAVIAGFASQFQ